MAAFLVDIDGTTCHFGTDKPLPGAISNLRRLINEGHQVIFTTQRQDVSGFKNMLAAHGLGKLQVIAGVQNHRVLVNDGGAQAIQPQTDTPWWQTNDRVAESPERIWWQ